MKKLENLQKIAEQASNYEHVITAEKQLAEAINQQLGQEKAKTPKQLVEPEEDLRTKIFLSTVEQTGFTPRKTSYILERYFEEWMETGNRRNLAKNLEPDTEDVEKVEKVINSFETLHYGLEQQKLQEETLVINEYELKELEKTVLPENYDAKELLKEEKEFDKEFKIFKSAGELVKAVLRSLDKLEPEETGIVVSKDSDYYSLLNSGLKTRDIPFETSEELSEKASIRRILSILRLGLETGSIRVKDVEPVAEELDLELSTGSSEKLISGIESESIRQVKEFLNVIPYMEYSEFVEELETEEKHVFKKILEETGLKNQEITAESVERLEHYIENYGTLSESEKGVKLADPTEKSFLNRKNVFFIGIDSNWVRDTETTEKRVKAVKQFQTLIQSGENRFLMVQNMKNCEEVVPCPYLNESLEKEFTNFKELPHGFYTHKEDSKSENAFSKQSTTITPQKREALSKSELNNLVMSPRLYFFSKIVPDREQIDRVKGNLFHDYAEFYISNTEFVNQKEDQKFLEVMIDQLRPFTEDLELERLETELRVGIQNIKKFIDSREIKKCHVPGYKPSPRENVFEDYFEKEISSKNSERYFKDKKHGMKGQVDLIVDETHLVDFKSGYKNSRSKVFRKSHVDTFEDVQWPDFQPLMYLSFHRRQVRGKKLEFTFFHFLEELGQSINGKADLEDKKTTIKYYPTSFSRKISEMEVYEKLIRGVSKSNNRRKTLEKLGYGQYKNFMEKNTPEKIFEKQEALESEFANDFISFAKQKVGDYKYVEKGVESAVKKLVEFRTQNYFRKDLDSFENFLEDRMKELNTYKEEGFPLGDRKPDELPERDLMLR
ncbi:MAG: hypothetical protein ABEJ83_04945 [Candidatus Nanohaloarchaea archaeon]